MISKTSNILDFYYRWHRFEQHNNISIIDFDLLQRGEEFPGTFTSREEAFEVLDHILSSMSSDNAGDFLLQKLTASRYFLRALQGEHIPFSEYVRNTMGVLPIYLPEAVLQDQLHKTEESYSNVNYEYTAESLKRFNEDQRLSQEDIEKQFVSFRDDIVPKVISWLNLHITLDYRISFIDKDEYWMNWISTDQQGKIHLQYNLNKRHDWTRGSTEFLVFHEICSHAIQVALWKKRIEEGNLPPEVGLTTCFTPEQFTMEGLAESLCYFYPENPFSPFGLVSLNQDHLNWFVWNNAHIMANESQPEKNIIEFVQSYLPLQSEDFIKKSIKEKTENPLGRTYQYIYGIALYYHKRIAEKLSIEERRRFVIDSFVNVNTPQAILKKYSIT